MRPSSSTYEPAGLFDEVLARGPVRVAVADRAWLIALLDAEAALARAQAQLDLIPRAAGAAIEAACTPDGYEVAALAAGAAGAGNPVLPLVRALRAAVGEPAAGYVHFGATSQDILDTAAMLVAHRALGALLGELAGAAAGAAALAREHRDTVMAGRTLLQQAMPVTFGLKAAGWLVALTEVAGRLAAIRGDRLAVQLGGATGTLAGSGGSGTALVDRYAAELGLAAPVLPWHTDRTRIAELAGGLAAAAGVTGKIARDLTLLAQSEVGEVAEDPTGQTGQSSAMPHKRNPIAAVSALGCAIQAPGLASTLYAAMVHEHERAAGAWHAEWRPLRELLTCTGSAATWLRASLAGLTVDRDAMAANLARLADTAGLADPRAHLGAAGELVDRALAGWEAP
jgi:3-carboxy-cis,cis-muconate cycloisomerase